MSFGINEPANQIEAKWDEVQPTLEQCEFSLATAYDELYIKY
jgi:hypothetical protein